MLYITVAMQSEARPLISALGLKKNHWTTHFRVYDSTECALIVSGTGKVQSAVSTTFLLAHYPIQKTDFFINFGTCGTTMPDIQPGTVFLANRIRDHETGREVFPDLLYRHGFMEAGLETFGQPVEQHHLNALHPDTGLVDMEAYGAFESARHFLPVHRIAVIKIVLDYLSPGEITKRHVEEQVMSGAKRVKKWIYEVSRHTPAAQACPTIHDPALDRRLDLSSTLNIELANLTRYLNRADPQGVSHASHMLRSIANGPETLSRRQTKEIISLLRKEIQAIPISV